MTSGVVDINVIDAFVGEFRHAVGPAKKKRGGIEEISGYLGSENYGRIIMSSFMLAVMK